MAWLLALAGCVSAPDFDDPAPPAGNGGAGGTGGGGASTSGGAAGAKTDATSDNTTTSATSSSGGSGSVQRSLQNPSFEAGFEGWSKLGDETAAYVESLNPYHGARNLATRASTEYQVSVEQPLLGLPATSHTMRAWVRSSKDLGNSYVYFRPANGEERTVAIPPGVSSALRLTLGDLQASDGSATIGVHLEGPAGSWANVDAFEWFEGPPEWDESFMVGGDLSFRRQLDDLGVAFHDASGNPVDVLDVLSDSGFNLARFRLHNNPGSPDHYPSNQFPAGYQDLEDTLANGRDCYEAGLQLLVSFHYSDYWTNPGQQYKPYLWEDLSETELAQAVYEYTRDAMQAFVDQGTPPYMVTLGNETNAGMLWPEGQILAGGVNFDGFANLFSAGAQAVKEVHPDTLVGVHISEPGPQMYEWLAWANEADLEYDVVGMSLYPFWSNLRVDQMKEVVERGIELTGKRVIAVETGYPWSTVRPSGYPTMIVSNGLNPEGRETFGATPYGQELYLRSFLQQLHDVPGFLGASYWDPIWLDTPALPSNVADTALFDWEGKPLRGLSAFQEKFR